MDKESHKLLEQINKSLTEINLRQKFNEGKSETDKLFEKSDRRVENSINQIQNTFDRIHDKVFNFNNIMIGAYLVLGTFPSNKPILPLWTIIFPILIMAFMVYIDYRQMEIHRFASREQEWSSEERYKYGKKINNQTLLSLFALFLSVICLFYLICSVI